MGIPTAPVITGDVKSDTEQAEAYKSLCLKSIHRGDLDSLPHGFPQDHLPEDLRGISGATEERPARRRKQKQE